MQFNTSKCPGKDRPTTAPYRSNWSINASRSKIMDVSNKATDIKFNERVLDKVKTFILSKMIQDGDVMDENRLPLQSFTWRPEGKIKIGRPKETKKNNHQRILNN
ncbi:hypothetical protein BsWGS_09214 [Bradybaena similaris]